ncbi:hypothetical protein VKT23_018440 [Stygiomarasmius scandens]|uniref:Uncharacterized protein n=1 Tax=Marasmiellus scandens TaxID=2682957 RepID=A0ABR1IP58_9AGAR
MDPSAIPPSASNPQIGTSSIINQKITSAIAGGIVGGLSFIILIALLFLWRKKHHSWRPLGKILPFINRHETTKGKEVDERPTPYDLKHVSVHIKNPIPHPRPNSTSEPTSTLEVPPNSEEYTTSLSDRLIGRNQPPFSLEIVSSNQNEPASDSGHCNAIHTRSRAFSESSLTRIPSITSQSTLTARQQIIRSEAEDLRMQLQAIQQAQAAAQQAVMLSNDEMKNTLAVMMAHIQRLDRQFDSEWARGLTDEAPPEYYDARR